MDIKEIAMKVGLQVFEEHPYDKGHVVSPSGYTWIDDKLIEFAEALISAYKAELLKDVGEPVAWVYTINRSHSIYSIMKPQEGTYDEGSLFPLYDERQVDPRIQGYAASLKATKPLEQQCERQAEASHYWHGEAQVLRTKLAAAQEELRSRDDFIAMLQETQKDQLAKAEQRVAEACKSMCLRLVRKENERAAGYGLGCLSYSAQDVADFIDNGDWRKFVKEV